MSTCFLVIGTPRSGTSCVAGVLSKLGVFVGDNLLPANEMNEAGFFQDIEFEELFDVCPEWMPEYPGKDLCDMNKLHALIRKRCKDHDFWGLKIRLGAFIVAEIEQYCKVKLVVTQRDRQASIDSLSKWFGPGDQDPEQVIDRAAVAVEAACDGREYQLVSYANILTNPDREVALIAARSGRRKTEQAVAFINPALKRY